MNEVWVVSGLDEEGRITISVFNNQEFASLCGEYFSEAGYTNVSVEVSPVYSKFIWTKDADE